MSYRGDEQTFTDFSGGMVSNKPPHTYPLNAAALVKNIVLMPGGGFRKRNGDTAFNSSAMGDPSAVVGLGYYLPSSGTEYLMAIAKSAIYKSEMDGTMDDISAALTIGAGANLTWTFSQMNDLAIFVGGAPNAPIKWNGTGNAAVLGGTPPNGQFGFTVNNRFFIGNTSSYPSTLFWSILANPEDWSGTGSGSIAIWNNDGDSLTAAAVITNDVTLIFKQNSIHQLITTSAPFPSFPLVKGVGCAGKHAVATADGVAYFITRDGKIRACDGSRVIRLPDDDIDDILSGINVSRLPYSVVTRQIGNGYDHMLFIFTNGSGSTNDICVVWDLNNKCWLYHPTGYACNVFATTQDKRLYGGHYDGVIYKKDVASTYSDASVSGGAIEGLWRWGWRTNNSFMYASRPNKLTLSYKSQSSGSINVLYGFDYNDDTNTVTLDQRGAGGLWDSAIWDVSLWGGASNYMKTVFLTGNGNTFQTTIQNKTSGETFQINAFSLGFKRQAQKEMSAT